MYLIAIRGKMKTYLNFYYTVKNKNYNKKRGKIKCTNIISI